MPLGAPERLRKRVFKRSSSKGVTEEVGQTQKAAKELQKIVDETIGYLCQIAELEAELISRLPATRIAEASEVTNATVVSEAYSDLLKIAELDAEIARCACKATEETIQVKASHAPCTDKDVQASLKRLDEAVANMCKNVGLDERNAKLEQDSHKGHGAGDKDTLSEEIAAPTSRNACMGVRGQKKKGRLVGRVTGVDEELLDLSRSGIEAKEEMKQEFHHAPVTIKDIQASIKRLEEAVANMCEIAGLDNQPKSHGHKSHTSLDNASDDSPKKGLNDQPEAQKQGQETKTSFGTAPNEIHEEGVDDQPKPIKKELHTSLEFNFDETLTDDIVDLIAELTVQDVLANIQDDEERLRRVNYTECFNVNVNWVTGTNKETETGGSDSLTDCFASGNESTSTEYL